MAEVALDRPDSAIARLTALLNDPALGPANRVIALGLLGDAFDGKGAVDAAFDAYTKSNEAQRRDNAPHFRAGDALQGALMLRRYFEAAPAGAWSADRDAPRDPRAAGHVFLVGFPRSGTTLLEQTLAGHPDIVTSEEHDLLGDAAQAFATSPAGLDTLAALRSDALAQYRDAYWARAAKPVWIRPARCSSTSCRSMHCSCRWSPSFSRRRRSCSRCAIRATWRSPASAAASRCRARCSSSSPSTAPHAITTRVMGAASAYRDKLGLDWRDVRHEDFVAGYENQARAIVAHLGLSWHSGITDVAERLKARAVDTPSSAQIAQGVREEGIGAWRAYAVQLEGVQPLLAPWVARFGYPP